MNQKRLGLILVMVTISLLSSGCNEPRYINSKGPKLETYEINKTVAPLELKYKIKEVEK